MAWLAANAEKIRNHHLVYFRSQRISLDNKNAVADIRMAYLLRASVPYCLINLGEIICLRAVQKRQALHR